MINALLADDHTGVRQGLRALLEKTPQFLVVSHAGNGRMAVQQVSWLLPDLVVVDFVMPGLNEADVTLLIKARVTRAKLIAISMPSQKAPVKRIPQGPADF